MTLSNYTTVGCLPFSLQRHLSNLLFFFIFLFSFPSFCFCFFHEQFIYNARVLFFNHLNPPHHICPRFYHPLRRPSIDLTIFYLSVLLLCMLQASHDPAVKLTNTGYWKASIPQAYYVTHSMDISLIHDSLLSASCLERAWDVAGS